MGNSSERVGCAIIKEKIRWETRPREWGALSEVLYGILMDRYAVRSSCKPRPFPSWKCSLAGQAYLVSLGLMAMTASQPKSKRRLGHRQVEAARAAGAHGGRASRDGMSRPTRAQHGGVCCCIPL